MTAVRYSSMWFRSWRVLKDRRSDDDFKIGTVGAATRKEVMDSLGPQQRVDFRKSKRVLVRWYRGRFQFQFFIGVDRFLQ